LRRVLQYTLVIIYFGAGWTKAWSGDWWQYSDCLQDIVQGYHRTSIASFMIRSLPDWAWTSTQYSTLVFEVGAPLWFLCRYTRTAAVLFGLSLHLMIALLMHRVWFFSLTMLAFYPVFWGECLNEMRLAVGWVTKLLGRTRSNAPS
jgi:hypothetical protein